MWPDARARARAVRRRPAPQSSRTDEDEPREWRIDQLQRAGSADKLRAFVGCSPSSTPRGQWPPGRIWAAWCIGMAARCLGDERSRQRLARGGRAAADARRRGAGPPRRPRRRRRRDDGGLRAHAAARAGQRPRPCGSARSRGPGRHRLRRSVSTSTSSWCSAWPRASCRPARGRTRCCPTASVAPRAASCCAWPAGAPGVEHRHLLAAMAAAGRRVLVYPRGDQRRSLQRPPSRWLLDSCEALGDGTRELRRRHRLASDRGLVRQPRHRRHVPGDPPGVPVAGTGRRGSNERRFSGARRRPGRSPAIRSSRETGAGRGLDLLAHRGRGVHTLRREPRVHGLPAALPGLAGSRHPSPSQLEAWLGCPHAYFMEYVLRVQPVDNPRSCWRSTRWSADPSSTTSSKWLRRSWSTVYRAGPGVAGGGARADAPARRRGLRRRRARGVTGHRLLCARRTRIVLASSASSTPTTSGGRRWA